MEDGKQKEILKFLTFVSEPTQPKVELLDGISFKSAVRPFAFADDTVTGPSLIPREYDEVPLSVPDAFRSQLRSMGIGIFPRGKPCSLFVWENMAEAMALAKFFTKKKTYEEFKDVVKSSQPEVNEEIYMFALMYAVTQRKDCRSIQLPPVEEVLPYMYFPDSVITEAQYKVKASVNDQEPIVVNFKFAHNELDPEFRLAYFREDLGLNSHHFHWHAAYPFLWTPDPDDPSDMKDRKGELFYYMHHQIVARYDAERLCNGLGRVQSLSLTHEFEEAYFPNLTFTASGEHYAARQAKTFPRDTAEISIEKMMTWKLQIMNAIHSGFVVTQHGERIQLTDPRGIDILGDIVEAAAIGVNKGLYGDYHNYGHRLISRVHDPDGRFGGERSLMGYSATAMRDPIFYRWHKTIDDLFNDYKITLSPYTKQELEWSDINILNVEVSSNATGSINYLETYWQLRQVLLSRGRNFDKPNPVSVSFNHLQHDEFVYAIEVDNLSGTKKEIIVRIFLTPVSGLNEALSLNDQRLLFMELDKYQTTVPPGKQVLKRRSEDSNVTISPVRGFQQLESVYMTPRSEPTEQEGFCGCGWPSHLLLPKGRSEGMKFVLLVMITDWEKDKVESLPEKACGDAASYCGIRDQKYPDKRAMGFPFDRRFNVGETLDSFSSISNVAYKEIIIRHTGNIADIDGNIRPATIT